MPSTARIMSLVAAAAVAAGVASPAAAAVTVFGGGKAEECAQAVFNGEKDRRFDRVCTEALDTEALSPRDRAGTYVNRGVLKLRRLQFISAQADFNRAIEAAPDFGAAYLNRGAALVGDRRWEAGLADLNKAIELGTEEPEKAYYNRGIAFEGLDDMKAAYLDYMKALELKPGWDMPQKELVRFNVERR